MFRRGLTVSLRTRKFVNKLRKGCSRTDGFYIADDSVTVIGKYAGMIPAAQHKTTTRTGSRSSLKCSLLAMDEGPTEKIPWVQGYANTGTISVSRLTLRVEETLHRNSLAMADLSM